MGLQSYTLKHVWSEHTLAVLGQERCAQRCTMTLHASQPPIAPRLFAIFARKAPPCLSRVLFWVFFSLCFMTIWPSTPTLSRGPAAFYGSSLCGGRRFVECVAVYALLALSAARCLLFAVYACTCFFLCLPDTFNLRFFAVYAASCFLFPVCCLLFVDCCSVLGAYRLLMFSAVYLVCVWYVLCCASVLFRFAVCCLLFCLPFAGGKPIGGRTPPPGSADERRFLAKRGHQAPQERDIPRCQCPPPRHEYTAPPMPP